MIVVDTNILAYLHLPGDLTPFAERLLVSEPIWCVPVLWRSEFANILAGYIRREHLDFEAAISVAEAAERRIGGREYRVPLPRVMELVARSNCRAYDCEFVALAIDLGVPLITEDRRIGEQFPTVARDMARHLG